MKSGAKLPSMLTNGSIYVVIIGTFLLHYANTTLSVWHIRLLYLIYGSMLWKSLIHMMLSHVTAQQFKPFRSTIMISCALVNIYLFVPFSWGVSEEILFWFLFFFNFIGNIFVSQQNIAYIQLIMKVSSEVKKIFGIRVFFVKETPKEMPN